MTMPEQSWFVGKENRGASKGRKAAPRPKHLTFPKTKNRSAEGNGGAILFWMSEGK
jgi:hypothetical protein